MKFDWHANKSLDDGEIPEFEPGELARFLKGAVRGKYVDPMRNLVHTVSLDPDVFAAFPNDKAVNDALRSLISRREETK